jgi:hypothetical protein
MKKDNEPICPIIHRVCSSKNCDIASCLATGGKVVYDKGGSMILDAKVKPAAGTDRYGNPQAIDPRNIE